MMKQFWLYKSTQQAPGIFDHFMGGLFLAKGVPIFLQLAVVILYSLALGFILLGARKNNTQKQKLWTKISNGCSLLAFFFCCLLLFSPWDECFINLRHSLNIAQNNLFSFNRSVPSEGTADFLVFFLLGWLGRLGLPLPELLFFQSFLGGLLCVFAIRSLAITLEIPGGKKWSVFLLTLFPTLLLNSAHGFASSIFAAAILWAIYFTFFERKLVLSFCLLSLIPLIRWEGFAFLLLCYIWYFTRGSEIKSKIPIILPLALLALLPVSLLSLYRFNHFQSWIPVPVIYKNSLGNAFYFTMGVRNFFLDLLSTLSFPFLVLWPLAFFLDKTVFKKVERLWGPLLILIAFTCPYYFSGGDWFPSAWGRYFLPLTLFAIPATWKLFTVQISENRRVLQLVFSFSLLLSSAIPTSSLIRFYQTSFSHGSALLSLNLKKRFENPLYRAHYLSQLGLHLKQTTDPSDKIGSSELATIMYFADRDAVDFIGLTDLELAQYPIRQTPSFLRKNPKAPELPLLIFKRVAPERLEMKHPEYLYLFDLMIEMLMDQKSTEGWSETEYIKLFRRWDIKFRGLVEPLYGGLKNISELGYIPILINYDNDFCSLYFVHKTQFRKHQARLEQAGFKGTLLEDKNS